MSMNISTRDQVVIMGEGKRKSARRVNDQPFDRRPSFDLVQAP
jgi:hypothetical protein